MKPQAWTHALKTGDFVLGDRPELKSRKRGVKGECSDDLSQLLTVSGSGCHCLCVSLVNSYRREIALRYEKSSSFPVKTESSMAFALRGDTFSSGDDLA